MPSTYDPLLRLELQATGENATTWGTKTNNNLELLAQAISGVIDVPLTGTSYTLTTNNGSSDQARNAVLNFTGTLAANCNVIVPSVDKPYIVRNSTTGGYSIIVKTSAGSGVTVGNGFTQQLFCDGVNVVAASVPFNNATNTISSNLLGNVTGNLTGNVTGNVTGNLTGNVTGNVTGTAANITGTAAIANGGTGATTAATALTNLGAAASGAVGSSGITMATARVLGRVTAGSGAIEEIALGNAAAALSLGINRGTEQATTSGTEKDFTGIPAGVRRITVMLDQVSTNSTSPLTVRLGTSGGIVATGYEGIQGVGDSVPPVFAGISTGFDLYNAAAAEDTTGIMTLVNQSGNLWLASFNGFVRSGASRYSTRMNGRVSLSGALTQLRLTTTAGTPTFDQGAVNIMWEF